MSESVLCNSSILQKQNEEIAMKKIEEANHKLQTIKKQCDEAKNDHYKLQMEVEKLKLKGSALHGLINSQNERENIIKTESERIAKELDDISWKRKIIDVKREMEKCNRKYYEDRMLNRDESSVPVDYMDVDEYRKKLEYEQELENLQNKAEDLQNKIIEKQRLNAEKEKLYFEAQKSQIAHLNVLRTTEKNLQNIENLILKQEEELKNLLK